MAVRDGVAGDLDALDALAGAMAASSWRCDLLGPDRPTRDQIAAYLAGAHGRHVWVIDETPLKAGMVHDGPLGKWWLVTPGAVVKSQIIELCQAVYAEFNDCWGYVQNPAVRSQLAGGQFTVNAATGLVRYSPV